VTKIYSKEKINKIKAYRMKGYTISDLVDIFKIPKTSIWYYIKDLKLSKEVIQGIKFRQGGSHKRKLERIEIAKEKAENLSQSKDWHEAVILAMLYWAEGSKRDFCFTNSDTDMIKLFLKILKKVFKVKKNSLYIVLRITDDMDKDNCLKYWSKKTGISTNNFKIRTNDGIHKMNSEFGICKVFVKKGRNLLKLVNAILEIEKIRTKPL